MKKLLITVILLGIVLAPLGAGVAVAQTSPGNAPAGNGEVKGACGIFSLGDCITFVFAEIGNAVLMIVSKVLDVAGAVLNFSVDTTINMSDFLAKVKIVDVGWKVFRDIANLFFIFVLLWIGIRTILGLGGGEIKKLLLNVILMAMLINFSLFITKAIVDAGNVATIHFYNAMRPDLIENGKVVGKAGLSDIYMEALKMQTFMGDASTASDAAASVGGFANQFMKIGIATILGSVFFLVAAFVFFAAAVLFIIRAVVLMLVMLLSPLAFVAQILPASQAQKLAGDWWDALFSQTFFAPLYMALTYAVAKAIQSGGFSNLLNITGNQASFAAVLTSPASDNVAIIVNYVILIILMVATLLIASKLGAYGSGMVMGWGKGLQKWGQGVAGRNTLGRLGGMLERNMKGGIFDKSPTLKTLRSVTTGALYGAKFGSGKSRKDVTAGARMEAAKARKEELDAQRRDAARDTATRITGLVNAGTPPPHTVIQGLSNDVIAEMDPNILTSVANSLSTGQLQRLNDTLNASQRTAMRNAILPPGVMTLPPPAPFSRAAYDFMTTGPGALW